MLTIDDILKFDKKEMHKIYDMWPDIAQKSYDSASDPIDFGDVNHIVFCGMGGSGTIGDIFSAILSKTNIHVTVVKGYTLPKTIDANTLVVATSISGNTVETLTTLQFAKSLDCKILGVSSGGLLEDYCMKNDILYRKIPMIHSPRASLVSFIYAMLHILENIVHIKKSTIAKSITQLEKRSLEISSKNLSQENKSIIIAQFIDKIPCIYYPQGLSCVAIRFKNSLQENSKIHVILENIVESSHNAIVPWEIDLQIKPILLQGKDDFIKTKERWSIMKDYFNENKINFLEVHSVEGDIFIKIIDLIYLLDYASIYRAFLSEIDPSPVKSIDFIKDKMNI